MARPSKTAWQECRVFSLGLLAMEQAKAEGRGCHYPGHPIGRPSYAPTHGIPYSSDTKDGPFEVCALCAEDYMRDRFGHQRTKDALAADAQAARDEYDAPA